MPTLEVSFGILIVLVLIFWELDSIRIRFKKNFPTAKERDRQWAMDNPDGHYEAHKKKG
jgi:hypothetical protein